MQQLIPCLRRATLAGTAGPQEFSLGGEFLWYLFPTLWPHTYFTKESRSRGSTTKSSQHDAINIVKQVWNGGPIKGLLYQIMIESSRVVVAFK